MTKQIWFPQLSNPPTAVREETKRKKSGENVGRQKKNIVVVVVVVVGVSFDGAPLQHLHIFKSDDEYHARGQTKTGQWGGPHPRCGLRSSRRSPSSSLGETQGSGVGTERPPELSRGRGATCSLR